VLRSNKRGSGRVVQVAEPLRRKCEALSSNPSIAKKKKRKKERKKKATKGTAKIDGDHLGKFAVIW
jgi:hypothetical protein